MNTISRSGWRNGWFVSMLASLFLAAAAGAEVAPVGTPASQFAASSTLAFTAAAGTNRVLVVTASDPAAPSGAAPSGVTFNGTPMAQASAVSDSNVAADSIWVLALGSGDAVTGNIVVSFAGTGMRFIGASVYQGAHQTAPFTAGPTNNLPLGTNLSSSLVVASAAGDLVYDVFDTFNPVGPSVIGIGPGQTAVHDGPGPVPSGFARYAVSVEAGAPGVTMSWTSSAQAILHATINIKAAPPGAATPSVTRGVTTVNTQTTSGLVITPNSVSVTHFKILGITNGSLFQNNGTTPIATGSFITVAQGGAGLKFTPSNGFTGNAGFTVAGSLDGAGTGLGNSATGDVVVASNILAGDLVIREFRSRGPAGVHDEYIEIANRTAGDLTLGATDGSGGFGVAAQNAGACPSGGLQLLVTIPDGTVIPAGGFYLAANNTPGTGYSLQNYGGPDAATPDSTWTIDMCDQSGLALFKSASTLDTTTRLDAVGFVGSTSPYIEGAGIPAPSATGTSEVVYLRNASSGVIQDTGANANDFFLGDTGAATFGTIKARLSAPGPQNVASESTAGLTFSLADPTKGATVFPNRWRSSLTATTGIYYFRWKVTNNTGAAITDLRLRLSAVTTLNSPGYVLGGTQADFRFVASPDVVISVPGSVTALAVAPEPPPTGLPLWGGYNASGAVTLPSGVLANGAAVYVNVALRYEQAGAYSYFVSAEAR